MRIFLVLILSLVTHTAFANEEEGGLNYCPIPEAKEENLDFCPIPDTNGNGIPDWMENKPEEDPVTSGDLFR